LPKKKKKESTELWGSILPVKKKKSFRGRKDEERWERGGGDGSGAKKTGTSSKIDPNGGEKDGTEGSKFIKRGNYREKEMNAYKGLFVRSGTPKRGRKMKRVRPWGKKRTAIGKSLAPMFSERVFELSSKKKK